MADDEWTHVTRPKKSRAPPPVSGNNPPSRELTVEKITAEFNAKMKAWQQSICRRTLLSVLDRVCPDGGWQLDRAVCLGSGSVSRDNLECRRRSTWQMVAFVDIVKHLGIQGAIYAQEPAFTAMDNDFLCTVGVRVLELDLEHKTPALGPTKDILGLSTFLWEPFVNMNSGMVQDMREKDVGLYMGSSIRGLIEKGTRAETTRESQKRLASAVKAGRLAKRFCEGRDMYHFPTFEVNPNVFEGIGIYCKADREGDKS